VSDLNYSAAELMVVAMAREIEDGDCLAQGIGTTLPACAYFLAKHTHAPNCVFLYSIGGTFSDASGPMSLTGMEKLALRSPLRRISYSEIVCEQLPGLRFKEFSRPAQVDGFGNTNNVVLTTEAGKQLRLPGVGGIPDFSGYESHHSYLYVPRQDRLTLVENVEFCSGVGAARGIKQPLSDLQPSGRGTRRLVTDLAVIEFGRVGATLVSIHPGVSLDEVRARCGFDLSVARYISETPAPTYEELELIRKTIDPLRIRDLELVPGRQRADRIRAIVSTELAAAGENK
jgi:acyl CoA:acetate/3-ketoacid CoA transferase beta subunit